MYDPKHPELEQWEKEYQRIQRNAVFFIENYWNQLHPEAPLELTDEEKQAIYEKYRAIPFIRDFGAYNQRLKELRTQGYKDWEIDA